jgi:crotonobetainyl-CoA:carnitine CoA-transferase CaiB-like acyl-CoA transferase
VRISPFGSSGPYQHWRSTDLVDQAIGGYVYLSGAPEREPLAGPADQAARAAGTFGAIGAMAALFTRRRTGRGQRVEVAHHEALAALHQFTELRWTHGHDVLRRMGNRYAGPGSPIGMYRAADGWMALTVATAAHMEVLLAVTGLDHLLERPDVTSIYDVMLDESILMPPFLEWLGQRPVAEAVELLQSARLAAAPVLTMSQLLDDPQLRARGWWHAVEAGGRAVELPGPPFHLSGRPWRTRPPGEGPVAAAGPAATATTTTAAAAAAAEGAPPTDGPLEGVKVLDLTRVWAGPLACRILADLGADVVMVEAPWARGPHDVPDTYVATTRFFPDNVGGDRPWNRNGFINKYAINKRSVALDLTVPEGIAAFERLAAAADVVVENFSPRVMPNFGLDEGRLAALNPELVYLTMPGYGRDGPAADYSAYGPVLDSHAGLSTLMGYPELDAWKCGIAWPDPVGGIHGALAVLLALWDRSAGPAGQGRVVELAQFETAVAMIGDRVVEAQLRGADPPLPGNRHPTWAPQGVYRSAGEDRWLAISVPDGATWSALCGAAGLPDTWAGWDEAERRARHDAIDEAVTSWSSRLDHVEAATRLQAAGVPAAPVVDGPALVADPHLAARRFFVELDHPEAGTHPWPRLPARLASSPATYRRPAPLLGQHNHEVLTGWAGYTAEEVDALVARGVVTTEPPAG